MRKPKHPSPYWMHDYAAYHFKRGRIVLGYYWLLKAYAAGLQIEIYGKVIPFPAPRR